MNPHHNSNQDPAIASAVQQLISLINQQTYNGNVGGLYPNNTPIAAPSPFTNFSDQPFHLQNTTAQFSIGGFNPQQNSNPFPVNQFNPSQQQQNQFYANDSMNRPAYNQNVGRPWQSQNPNYSQYPSHQNPVFPANQQFDKSNFNRPLQHANQGQLRFLSPMIDGNAPGSIQAQQSQHLLTILNYLQLAQGVVPQNHNFHPNSSGPMQHGIQGQQGFVSPMMDVKASRQIPNKGQKGNLLLPDASTSAQTHKPCPTITNHELTKDKHGNVATNVNTVEVESQNKNFTGDKKNDASASHKGFKSEFHHAKNVKNGNMNKAKGKSNAAVKSGPQKSTNSKKKRVDSVKYTDEEIKKWREDRKKHYPTSVQNSKKEEASMLRCQELKKILAKQAELGCEVAEIPSYYLSGLSTPPQITSHSGHVRICTLNVETLDEKFAQLTDALSKRKVDIACIQVTKWKGAETTECNGYKLWYTHLENTIKGVGILLSPNLKDKVVEVKTCHDKIIAIKVVVEEEAINVVSAYAPHSEESENNSFWESLDDVVKGVLDNECMFIGGNFNGHIGKDANGFGKVHGGLGFGTRNEEGRRLLEFASAHNLAVVNSFFKKKDVHLITFQSEGHNSQIDYLLLPKRDFKACIDCKVLPGETNNSQHRLLIMDVYMSVIKRIAKEKQLKEIYAKQAQLRGEVGKLSRLSIFKRRRQNGRVRICTWNVGTWNDNLLELTNALSKREVDITCMQETKLKGKETKDCNGYRLWHAGTKNATNGVGILLSTNLKDNVVAVRRFRDRIIAIKVKVDQKVKMVNIICAYAPNEESEKNRFWESLDDVVKGVSYRECMLLGGDFGGHIGKEADGFEIVHGGSGFGTTNEEGRRLLEFATAHDLVVVNSFYRRDTHMITVCGDHNTQNDYLLMRKRDVRACIDCQVLPGETSASQHKLLVMDLYLNLIKRIKKPKRKKSDKKGKFHNKKRKTISENDRIAKKTKTEDYPNQNLPNEQEPSLLQKQ